MTIAELERIATLLKNYDERLRDKAEHYADMMADWADASEATTRHYADKYSVVRIERQRVHDSLLEIEKGIKDLESKAE